MTINQTEKPKVLYIPWDKPIHDEEAWRELNEKFDLVVYDCATEKDFIEEIQKEDGKFAGIQAICKSVWLKSEPYIHHYLFRGEPVKYLPDSVKIIVQSGHGYDIVDVDQLTRKKILFCNSPDSCTIATADVGTYLVLSSFRYLTYAENCVRTGNYYQSQNIPYWGDNPNGKTLGVIGLGNIGLRIARSCQAFGMNVVYYGRTRKLNKEKELLEPAKYYSDLNEMLACTDCILVSCPHTPATQHLINEERFKHMKSQVRLVNIARGPIVEEAAVIKALDDGQLIGAGFDVHEFEPKIHPRLLDNYKVTLLPHSGPSTKDSFKEFERKCVKNLVEYFYGTGIPPTLVNKEVLEEFEK